MIPRRALGGLGGAAALLPAWARAQDFPSRPLRMVVAYAPGGGTDLMARAVAAHMQGTLGRAVAVENRAGATGAIGAQAVATAAPDGHTLFFASGTEFTLQPLLDRHLPYDPDRDFVPITLLGITPIALAVRADLPAADLAAFIALARARAGAVSYASSGPGSINHLTGELFRQRAGLELVHVPYRGAAPAVTDTAAGQVDAVFSGLPPALPLVRAGRLRLLAVSTPRRAAAVPDLPTMAESGLAGFDMSNSVGLVAPAGTPPEALRSLGEAANRALADPAVRAVFGRNGADVLGGTAADYAAFIREERARLAEAVAAAGLGGR